MTIFGIPTRDERVLKDNLARTQRELVKAKDGRDRLAHRLIYTELRKDQPALGALFAQLLGASYTDEEVVVLFEETKRALNAEVS